MLRVVLIRRRLLRLTVSVNRVRRRGFLNWGVVYHIGNVIERRRLLLLVALCLLPPAARARETQSEKKLKCFVESCGPCVCVW